MCFVLCGVQVVYVGVRAAFLGTRVVSRALSLVLFGAPCAYCSLVARAVCLCICFLQNYSDSFDDYKTTVTHSMFTETASREVVLVQQFKT